MNSWISVEERLPELDELVWACNAETRAVALASRFDPGEGWIWAVSNGLVFSEDNRIVGDCEADDDYQFTHWSSLPSLPFGKPESSRDGMPNLENDNFWFGALKACVDELKKNM